MQTVLIFGICGACRSDEITNMTVSNVKDDGNEIVFRIPDTKTKVSKFYPIDKVFAEIVRSNMALRPPQTKTDRFFIRYWKGKCTTQVIGSNMIRQMPKKIAESLGLPSPETYTGHAFRRSSTTVLADQGADIETLKRHGVWKSANVPRGKIVNRKKFIT